MKTHATITEPCSVCKGSGSILDFRRLYDLNGPCRPTRKCPHCVNGRAFKRGYGNVKRYLKAIF